MVWIRVFCRLADLGTSNVVADDDNLDGAHIEAWEVGVVDIGGAAEHVSNDVMGTGGVTIFCNHILKAS